MKVRFARAAERDLEDIGDWIARDDPDAAARFTAELEGKARQIADVPFAFPAVGAPAGSKLRKRSYRGYIIYYRVGRTAVTIVGFVHQSRDQAALLRKS